MANETIVINDDLRTMQIPSSIVLLGVESDDDVNKLPFQMPKEYCGFDLSQFEARINYMNQNGDGDVYIVDDLAVDGDDPSLMNFTWLVGRNACAYKGSTKFIVCLKKFDDKQNVVQEFNTTVYSLPVLEGLETTQAVVQQNADIIEYILKAIEEAGSIDLSNYYTKAEVNALKLPNPNALTINGVDYDGTEAVEMEIQGASQTTETVDGTILHVTDAVPDTAVKSLNLFDENGDTISSATICITNKNLFRLDQIATQTVSKGITFDKNPDGSITATGTSTGTYAAAQCEIDASAFVVGQTYTISSGKTGGVLYVQLIVNYADGTTDYLVANSTPYVFSVAKPIASVIGSVQITNSGVTVNERIFPMVELSDSASAFTDNVYNTMTFNGSTMPVLPDSVSNIWSTDSTVDNIVMEYWNDPILAQVNELEKQFYTQIQHDDALDDVSEHAVQNKVITAALNTKLDSPSSGISGQVLTKTPNGHEWQSKEYVTPQMFGAKGDGITDDTVAFQALSGKTAYIPEGTYIVSHAEFARKTTLFGSGMGKTVIKQKSGETGDLFDFVDADCSGMVDMSLIGNKNETSSDIYRALLKIRTTRDHVVNYSNYCNFEHLLIRNASASGLVLLGRSSADPSHPLSNHNWVHHFNDIRVEECNLWCMLDETSDNLFSNLYLNEGDLGNLRCYHASSNMYVNLKLDQPYGGGGSGTLEGFDDGALILLKNCENIRFVNIDLQSAYYVGAKVYSCSAIHFDGDINNCGLGADGHGIGLWLKNTNHCTFNVEIHDLGAHPEHNVKIESDCLYVSVYANQRYVTENINNAQGTCFIVDPADISNLYNSTIETTQTMNNLFANPLCDSLDGWKKTSVEQISIDTNSETTGTNSFKFVGDTTKTVNVYQTFSGLKPNDYYMCLAVVNVEQLPTNGSTPMYIVMATGGYDSGVYTVHKNVPKQLGKHLIAQVGKISDGGDLEPRFYAYKNDGIYYIGNFMLFNLTDLGIANPAKPSTYSTIYQKLQAVMNEPFNTIDIKWDYTQIMGILKYILKKIA